MKFDDALLHAVAHCESIGTDDPFYLYCVLSDHVGANYAGKDAVRMLFEIDRRIQVVGNIAKSGKAACILSKAAYPAFKEQYGRKEFCDFLDDVFLHPDARAERGAAEHAGVRKGRKGGRRQAKGK